MAHMHNAVKGNWYPALDIKTEKKKKRPAMGLNPHPLHEPNALLNDVRACRHRSPALPTTNPAQRRGGSGGGEGWRADVRAVPDTQTGATGTAVCPLQCLWGGGQGVTGVAWGGGGGGRGEKWLQNGIIKCLAVLLSLEEAI